MSDEKQKVGILLNPNAGHFRTRKGKKRMETLVGKLGKNGELQEKYSDRIVIGAKKKSGDVQYACDEFSEHGVDLIIAMGGDGTWQNLITNYARRLYSRTKRSAGPSDKKNSELVNFLKTLNTEEGEKLPYMYTVKAGTVYAISNVIDSTKDLELAIDNAFLAYDGGQGMKSFRRAYLPTMISYSDEEPNNPSRMETLIQYADSGVRRFYDAYYKDEGPGKPNVRTAYKIIGKALMSLPFSDGFVYDLTRKIPCNIEIDGVKIGIDERTMMFASTIDASLYGLKPFHRARGAFKDFERRYEAGECEVVPDCATAREFHVLTGDFEPWRAFNAVPNCVMGKPLGIKGLYDELASEITISQHENVEYIADGNLKEEGKKLILTTGFEVGVPYLHEKPILKF